MKKNLLYLVSLILGISLSQCSNPVGPIEDHLQKLWEVPLSEISNSGFAVSNNSLILKTQVNTTGQLYKISMDGKNIQTASIGGSTRGVPVVLNNVIYSNTSAYSLYALNEGDLSIIWSRNGFAWIPIPNADDNYVYVTDLDMISALNKSNGSTVWSTNIIGKNGANPVIDGNTIYFATGIIFKGDGYLYSINKIDGSINYQINIPYLENKSQFGGSRAGVEIWNNQIYVSGDNRIFYCFNKNSGELLWTFEADAPIEATSRVSEGYVYFGTLNRTCYALDANSGMIKWTYQGGGSIKFEPSFYQNYVMFKASGALLVLDKNSGKELFKMSSSTTNYGFMNAFWDADGKIYASGFKESNQKPMLIAFQFK